MTENFDFSKTLEALKNYSYDGNDRYQALVDLLRVTLLDFPAHATQFFEEDFRNLARASLRKHRSPDTDQDGSLAFDGVPYQKFMTEEERQTLSPNGTLRNRLSYPLTRSETETVNEYLYFNTEYEGAMGAIHACISGYYEALDDRINRSGFTMDENSRHLWEAIFGNATGFSFLHDLMPVMAHALYGNKAEDGSAKSYGGALSQSFGYHAFKSQKSKKTSSKQRCPFSAVIGDVLGYQFEEKEDGSLSLLDDRKPGALIAFARKKWIALDCPVKGWSHDHFDTLPPDIWDVDDLDNV